MIVWRGKGLLAPLAFIIGAFLANVIHSVLHLNMNEKNDSIIFGCVWGIFSASINYLLTKKFVSDQVRYMIDEATGQRIAFRDRSSFMFIPNRYWTWIFATTCILVSLVSLVK